MASIKMGFLKLLFGALLIGQLPIGHATIENASIAPRPPMGFNNWARFQCNLSQELFTTTADHMASNGLLAAGYNRINLDDCWLESSRAPNGSLVWNSTLFPDGLIWLGRYLHDKGFHFGIYEDAGNLTCGGYPGSKDHEQLDAETFASWGIDYLKMDGCNVLNNSDSRSFLQQYEERYATWHKVLSGLESPMVFSESAPAYFAPSNQDPANPNNTDWYKIMNFAHTHGELARHSDDISVYATQGGHWKSILRNYGFNTLLARYQRCGFYNDPDFLIPTFPDINLDEMKSQFALWASFSAPLIISAYIPELTKEELEYLTNPRIIEVNQDSLCQQATLVSQDGQWDVLTKSLSNGDRLLTVLNRGDTQNSTSVPLPRTGLPQHLNYSATDLWTGKSFNLESSVPVVEVPSHGTAIFRIKKNGDAKHEVVTTPTGMIFNTLSLRCLSYQNSTNSTQGQLAVNFANCTSADSQVWQVTPRGLVRPLSNPKLCLTPSTGQAGLNLQACNGSLEQRWVYGISGNLHSSTQTCVTEGAAGEVGLAKCGDELDSQVFGLPVGVFVAENEPSEHDRISPSPGRMRKLQA